MITWQEMRDAARVVNRAGGVPWESIGGEIWVGGICLGSFRDPIAARSAVAAHNFFLSCFNALVRSRKIILDLRKIQKDA